MRFFPNLVSRFRDQQSCSRFSANTRTMVAAFALAFTASIQAQPIAQPQVPAHGHTAQAVSASMKTAELTYRSVFERYQSFRDEKVGSWREANDTVTRVGGWREYLKEAQRPESTGNAMPNTNSSSTPAPVPATKTDPHAGHGVKK